MGNLASANYVADTLKKKSWGQQKEDTVKLEDLLTKYKEELWSINRKQSSSMKKLHFNRSMPYMDLADQKMGDFHMYANNMLNPSFTGDQNS